MTRRTTHTTTIQLWPGGQSVTYRGDIDGPPNQRSLRLGGRNGEPDGRWVKGTAEEWRQIRINTRAELYGRREILCCDSGLVDDLIKAASTGSLNSETRDLGHAFEGDQIENLYPDPSDWDAEQCRDWLEEHGHDPAGVHRADGSTPDDSDDEYIEELREAVRDHAEAAEVYEWWRVSSWLCKQLRAIGEVVIDNGYGHWWGRQGTGQGWIMDGTLQQVAARFETEG